MYNEDVMNIIYEGIGIDSNNDTVLDEEYQELLEAEFKFLPQFKHDFIPKEILKLMDQSNSILAREGIQDKMTANKVLRLIFRALSIIENVFDVIYFPILLVPILGWIIYLLSRLWEWAMRYGEEYFMKAQAKDVIAKLARIRKETHSKEVRDKCDSMIKKMEEKIKQAEESTNESYDPWAGLEESYDPWSGLEESYDPWADLY